MHLTLGDRCAQHQEPRSPSTFVGTKLGHVMGPVDQHLWEDLCSGTQRLKQEIGYDPHYFKAMVGEHGPLEACLQLIRSSTPSTGFTKLWEHQMLDMTVEAIALLPWYSTLFSDEDRQLARRRLLDYKFDVDGFLARRGGSPPRWYLEVAFDDNAK